MLTLKFIALLGAAVGVYLAAALQSGPEVADANLCKLLRRVSSAVPDQCIPSIDDYGAAIAIIFAVACVLLLLFDFRKHVFVSRGFSAAIKRQWEKLDPYLIPIGLGLVIIGAVILAYTTYKQSAAAKALRAEFSKIENLLAEAQKPKPAAAGPRQSMLSGRPVSGLEIAQRLERVESELDSTKQELTTTKQKLADAQQAKVPTKKLSRIDFEERRKALNAFYKLVNGPIRDAYNTSWGLYNDQPRLINNNQKAVFEELVKIRTQLIPSIHELNVMIRECELYPDIRNLNWNFQEPILGTLNELINHLRGTVEGGGIVFVDSKETDKLRTGIDTLGQWIEKTKDTIQKIKSEDDAADIIDKPGATTTSAPLKKSSLDWNIEENAENVNFLGLSLGPNGPQAHHFWTRGWNRTIEPITSPHAYIRAENTATKFDGLFNPGDGKLLPADKIETIPVGAMIDITVPFRPDRTPIPLSNFLAEFVPFTFFFSSPEASYRQTITREQIEHRIKTFQDAVNAKLITRPKIQLKDDTNDA